MTSPAILFDLYGVLLAEQTPQQLRAIEDAAGSGPELWAVYWRLRPALDAGELTVTQYWDTVAQTLGLDRIDVAAVIAADIASWLDPIDETITLAQGLVRAGHPVGVLSNIPDFLAREVIRTHHHWLDELAPVVFSCDIGAAKPDPRAYAAAAEGFGLRPEQVVFFDDNQDNVDGARRCGLTAHLVTGPDSIRDVVGPWLASSNETLPPERKKATDLCPSSCPSTATHPASTRRRLSPTTPPSSGM